MGKDDKGPDLTQGVSFAALSAKGMVAGRVGAEAVLLVRRGEAVFAVGATCPHLGAPLVDGLAVGETIRCPWHHACFSLRSGEALAAPAFDALGTWHVERDGDRIWVTERLPPPPPRGIGAGAPGRIVILGGGAAGFAAAERLRREGFGGTVTLLSDDTEQPYDRTLLSKDYLIGRVPEAGLPLRPDGFYEASGIELRLGITATRIDAARQRLHLAGGEVLPFDRLLLATGAEPVRPKLPGAADPAVLVLRTARDCRAIIQRSAAARTAVLVGAGFIGLEVAAALRERGLRVTVVAPEAEPLARILGPDLSALVRREHEAKGVVFRLGAKVASLGATGVVLEGGEVLVADLVVIGAGVTPRTALAEAAGIRTEDGLLVDEYLETSAPTIFAAGDVARWPDPHSGERIRVEHWVVAQRMGQVAALNMLGRRKPFDVVPFFWSRHFDALNIGMIGHAPSWDEIAVEGEVAARRAVVRYRREGRMLATATVDRDLDNLRTEQAMEAALEPGP
ncbi:FAD-dependent oxidoreductase [Paeniroseomonas aquatica]|uniref:FAD-dependent oxidoreductase n=1 Tax=Paeniroseomonas aquatica TaxID=373043 RepID=A0ABT8A0C9_9PROT|nr:FAD-dependent oxidoreductase [Paeniroseomonas aquatica]MDN3563192.1 FAD-dependent oxidoreductase [Paeniroseomonas aquatica]